MERSIWQDEGGECAAVLECVFACVPAETLWRCRGVCRAWRRAARDDALWRRAVLGHATPHVLRAFAAVAKRNKDNKSWSWQREYQASAARWRRRDALPARGPLAHAALHPLAHRLALLAEDATITIWERTEGEWRESWAGSFLARGWRRGEVARWAPAPGARLLVAGPLALCDRWELAVLQPTEEGSWRVVCRADAGASGGTCWAGDAAFLSLRPQLLAPGLAITTIWLNAVSQEASSEYSGVTTPLLRIFNESAAHIPHTIMTEMPSEPIDVSVEDEIVEEAEEGKDCGPLAQYYMAISAINHPQENADRIFIAAMGAAGGPRGQARALGAWRVRASALTPPPLVVGAGLAERVRRRRLREVAGEDEEPPPPGEQTVRALCTPPDDVCSLGAQVLGLVLHPRGSCVWASTERGATCVSLPTLRRVLHIPLVSPLASPPPAPPHYVTPDVDDDYFVTPEGGGSGLVHVAAARSGRRGVPLKCGGPAIATTLVAPAAARAGNASHTLLVLTTDAVHRSSGVRASSRAPRSSCEDAPPPPCPPCRRAAPPPCRAAPPRCRPALRLACCPPRPRPPPPPCVPELPLSCQNARVPSEKTRKSTDCLSASGPCGAELDQVAQRLAAAAAARRADYEREAAARAASAPERPERPPRDAYRLAAGRECVRATDGCDYTVSSTSPPPPQPQPHGRPGCGPNREPPPPQAIELLPNDACEIRHKHHIDPCAHQPRILLEIDRTPVDAASKASPEKHVAASADCPKLPSTRERLTTRIMESLNLKRERKSCPRSSCAGRDTEEDRPGWCANPPKPVAVPARCREPSIVEQLRQRPGGTGGSHCNPNGKQSRKLHTSTVLMMAAKGYPPSKNSSTDTPAKDPSKINQGHGLDAALRERAQHKEIALGRVVPPEEAGSAPTSPGAGHLELRIPPASDSVRVRVSLDFVPLQNVSCLTPKAVAPITESCHHAHAQLATSRTLCSNNNKSWLSIRGIQKKWSGYCKKENTDKKTVDTEAQVLPKCPTSVDIEIQRKSAPDICGNQTKPPPNICDPQSKLPANICGPQSKPSTNCGPEKSSECPKTPTKPSDNKRCGCPPGGDTRRCSSALVLLQTVY